MKARPTSGYKVNDLGNKRIDQTNFGDSSTENTMADHMYYDAEPISDAGQPSKCVETPKSEDEYVVMCDQEETADMKSQASDEAVNLKENTYYEGFGDVLKPTDGKVTEGGACIKVVDAPISNGEMQDKLFCEGSVHLTTAGNAQRTNQTKITDKLQTCSSDIKMSANGKYHSALSEQQVARDDFELTDNPYYDNTGEPDHIILTQLSKQKGSCGDDIEMVDNPYYDGTSNL